MTKQLVSVCVLVVAVLAFAGFMLFGGATIADAAYRSITLLVVASPCTQRVGRMPRRARPL